jgi:hypothetical protein
VERRPLPLAPSIRALGGLDRKLDLARPEQRLAPEHRRRELSGAARGDAGAHDARGPIEASHLSVDEPRRRVERRGTRLRRDRGLVDEEIEQRVVLKGVHGVECRTTEPVGGVSKA